MPGHREVDRGDQVLARAVVIDAVAQRQTLDALGDDRQHRAGHRGLRRSGMNGLADPDTVDRSGQVGTRMPFQQAAKLVQGHATIAAHEPR